MGLALSNADERIALDADAHPKASARLPSLRALEEREQIRRDIVRRLPLGIMTDAGTDFKYRARDARSKALLLPPRKDTVLVAAQDQHRTADSGAICRGIGCKKAG